MNERTKRRWLAIARGLLECPTAPLMEDVAAQHVWDFAGARPSLFRRQDAAGNLLVGYPASGTGAAAPLVVVAHLDHPAFCIERVVGTTVELGFRGGVRIEHVHRGAGVCFFVRGSATMTGRGTLTRVVEKKGRLFAAEARVRSGTVAKPGFATWDVPPFRVRGATIEAGACDDLMGCATLLCMLDELHRSRPRGAAVWALFTRAEELGFFGALAAAKGRLLPRGARVISVETSRALAHAPQGAGVILRVGDASGVFDPGLCAVVHNAAKDLEKSARGFRHQRRLMDGGTCEALAFAHAGYRTTGLSLPLANYHNQAGLDGGRKTLGVESVRVSDFCAAVDLLVHLARAGARWDRWQRATGTRMAALQRRAERAIAAHPLLRLDA